MKIYTKTGDDGETGLLGGVRVGKNHVCVEVCGSLDELNSIIGLVRSGQLDETTESVLLQIQHDLFDLGGRVAGSLGESGRKPGFKNSRVNFLEQSIDQLEVDLPELKQFILPDGCVDGCRLHLARAICRRAERSLVKLRQLEIKYDLASELVYLNRLSDWLFVAARHVNHLAGRSETPWSATSE